MNQRVTNSKRTWSFSVIFALSDLMSFNKDPRKAVNNLELAEASQIKDAN